MVSDFELFASTIGAALGGGILAVAGEEAVRWYRRPQMNVHFEDKSEYFTEAPTDWPVDHSDPDKGTVSLTSMMVRIKVTNTGRTTARKCRAYMTRIVRTDSGSRQIIADQDSLPLFWSLYGQGAAPVDIPVGINQFIDVAATLSRDTPQKLFPLAIFPNRFRPSWDKPGAFEIEILVAADNAAPATKTIRFRWDGPWKTLRFA